MKLGLLFAIVMLFILLTGCVRADSMFQAGTDHGARAADAALTGAVWYVCKGASVGAVNRRFGGKPGPYKALCAGELMGVVGP